MFWCPGGHTSMWSSHQRSKGYFTAGVESKGQPWTAPVRLDKSFSQTWEWLIIFRTSKNCTASLHKREEFCSQSRMCNKSMPIPLNSMEVIPNLYLWESCNLSMKCFQQNDSKSFASLHKVHNMPVKQVNTIQIKYVYVSPVYSCVNCSRRAQLLTTS